MSSKCSKVSQHQLNFATCKRSEDASFIAQEISKKNSIIYSELTIVLFGSSMLELLETIGNSAFIVLYCFDLPQRLFHLAQVCFILSRCVLFYLCSLSYPCVLSYLLPILIILTILQFKCRLIQSTCLLPVYKLSILYIQTAKTTFIF